MNNDRFNQIGKYLKNSSNKVDLSLKRPFIPMTSVEKVRDIFDADTPFKSTLNVPYNTSSVFLDLTFGPRLPSVDCCGDCICGATESYTSDSLIGGNIYISAPYLANSSLVYLDGIRVSQGVEYTESSPALGQFEIHIPFSTITISYNYTVGNCSNQSDICVDTFPCPEYAIFSGLATVFADRFDVGQLEGTGQTYGGCGIWSSNPTAIPPTPTDVFRGSGSAGIGNNRYATLGGLSKVSGKTIEIILATASGGNVELSPISLNHSISMNAQFTSSVNLRFTLSTFARYHYSQSHSFGAPDTYHNNEDQITKIVDVTVPVNFATRPSYVRAAQYPNGDLVMRLWEQGTEESTAYSATLTIADYTIPTLSAGRTYLSSDLIALTFYAVRVEAQIRSIKIGVGLDKGDWGINAASSAFGYALNVCRYLPDSLYAPHPYFAGCDSAEQITVNPSSATIAKYQAMISWPVVVGDFPPEGSGRVSEIESDTGLLGCVPGYPAALQITGKVSVSFPTALGVSVIFSSFPGTGAVGYNNNNFTGNQIASYFIATNTDPVPFSILIPQEGGVARWGVHIAGLDSLAPSLDFIVPGFLSAPNYWMHVTLEDVVVEAIQSVDCNAGETCGDCIDVRCPEVEDSFYTESYPMFHTPNFVEFSRAATSGISMVIEQDDGTEFTGSGGVGTITFPGDLTDDFSGVYIRYPLSPFQCRTRLDENIQATFEFKINTLSPTGGYSEISYGGYNDGTSGLIEFGAGIVQDCFISAGFTSATVPQSITAGDWFTVDFRTNQLNVQSRIYRTGTSPTDWTTIAANSVSSGDFPVIANGVDQFYVAGVYDFDANPSNTIIEFKNISIRRITI